MSEHKTWGTDLALISTSFALSRVRSSKNPSPTDAPRIGNVALCACLVRYDRIDGIVMSGRQVGSGEVGPHWALAPSAVVALKGRTKNRAVFIKLLAGSLLCALTRRS